MVLTMAMLLCVPMGTAVAAVGGLTTVAGSGVPGFSGDGGPATAGQLNEPAGLAVDGTGRLLVADAANHAVRRVDADGDITTIAGSGHAAGYSGDGGAATDAQLDQPRDVALRPNGIAFVADTGNHVIRDIDKNGVITTVAGTASPGYGGDGGPATAAQLRQPSGVASRPSGVILIADTGNHRIRMVDTGGVITTVAGTGQPGSGGDAGPATAAQLRSPEGVAVLPNGTIYITDTGNHRVRKIDNSGVITTVAGVGTPGYSGDGASATEAKLRFPSGLSISPDGSILVTDTGNHAIRRIDGSGGITTLVGNGHPGFSEDGTPATAARLQTPASAVQVDGTMAFSDTGNHRIRAIQSRPDAPTFTGTLPPSPHKSTTPTLVGLADAGTTVFIFTNERCSSTAVASGSAEAFASGGIAVTVAAGTTTTFSARVKDAAGRTSDCSATPITYSADAPDRTPPRPPRFTTVPEHVAEAHTPEWEFVTVDDAVTTTCRLTGPGGNVVVPWMSCEDGFGADLTGQPDGEYLLEVTATDAAGNTSSPAESTYRLETKEPSPAKPAPPAAPAPVPSSEPARSEEPSSPIPPVNHKEPAEDPAATLAPVSGEDRLRELQPRKVTAVQPQPQPYPQPHAAPADATLASTTSEPSPRIPTLGQRLLRGGLDAVATTVTAAGRLAGEHADEAALPGALLASMFCFVAVQRQIDRRDPKLALAPIDEDPELEFTLAPAMEHLR